MLLFLIVVLKVKIKAILGLHWKQKKFHLEQLHNVRIRIQESKYIDSWFSALNTIIDLFSVVYLFLFFSSMAALPSAKMVVISPDMKAQGTLEPERGQRSPLGQNTSLFAPCFLIESAEQGKQNLWWPTVGH